MKYIVNGDNVIFCDNDGDVIVSMEGKCPTDIGLHDCTGCCENFECEKCISEALKEVKDIEVILHTEEKDEPEPEEENEATPYEFYGVQILTTDSVEDTFVNLTKMYSNYDLKYLVILLNEFLDKNR